MCIFDVAYWPVMLVTFIVAHVVMAIMFFGARCTSMLIKKGGKKNGEVV